MSVEIFTDANFSGTTSGSIDQDSPYVGDFWNDEISSIKIYSGTWEFFEDANFQGKSFRLTPGEYSWVTNTWNDMISSFKQVGQGTPSSGGGGSMAEEILNAHNSYRSQVGVPPLNWSDTLASQAQEWAKHLSDTGKFEHSNSGQGENLWKGTSNSFSFTNMVENWGNEKKNFIVGGVSPDFSTTGQFKDVGHYTQLVWRNTTQVGCAVVDGSDGNAILVCRYDPSGNVQGQSPY
jgi:uncharacterized protein YkwD